MENVISPGHIWDTMKLKLIVFIVFVLLMSGCLDFIGPKVPVVYANITVSEDPNGGVYIQQIVAYAGEMPKIRALEEQVPNDWPAIFVNVVQNMMRLNYYTGQDYHGPGAYNFVIGMENDFNKTAPMFISSYVSFKDNTTNPTVMLFNWSTEVQTLNVTFK